jgi:hypothetical protein
LVSEDKANTGQLLLRSRSLTDVLPMNADEVLEQYNSDSVLLTKEFFDEMKHKEAELLKTANDLHSDLEFSLHQINTDSAEEVKAQSAEAARKAAEEAHKFEMLAAVVSEEQRRADAEAGHSQEVQSSQLSNLEKAYETSLARAMHRYDALADKVESIQRVSVEQLNSAEALAERELRRKQKHAQRKAREMKLQCDKLAEECRLGARFHHAALGQQESEYETEVTRLMAEATKEMFEQRQLSTKLRGQAQLNNTRALQMEKTMRKMKEDNAATEAEAVKVEAVNAELGLAVVAMEADISRKQTHLNEAVGEEMELSATNKRLETFHHVLDSKLQTVQGEVGPLEGRVEELDHAKHRLNQELAKEFENKEALRRHVQGQNDHEKGLAEDVEEVNQRLKRAEKVALEFRLELGNLVEGVSDSSRLRKGAVVLAKKFLDLPSDGSAVVAAAAAATKNGAQEKKGNRKANATRRQSTSNKKGSGGGGGGGSKGAGAAAAGGDDGGVDGVGGGGGGGGGMLNLGGIGDGLEEDNALQEDNFKTEIGAVVKRRDMLTGELKTRSTELGRITAAGERSTVVRGHENVWMISECNRLRRENLMARREELALERQVEAWKERTSSWRTQQQHHDGDGEDGDGGNNDGDASVFSGASSVSLRGAEEEFAGSYYHHGSDDAATTVVPYDGEVSLTTHSITSQTMVGMMQHKPHYPHATAAAAGSPSLSQKSSPDFHLDGKSGGGCGGGQYLASPKPPVLSTPSSPAGTPKGIAADSGLPSSPSGKLQRQFFRATAAAAADNNGGEEGAGDKGGGGRGQFVGGGGAGWRGADNKQPAEGIALPFIGQKVRRAVGTGKGGVRLGKANGLGPSNQPGRADRAAMANASWEHDELAYSLYESRQAISEQQALLEVLRRAAYEGQVRKQDRRQRKQQQQSNPNQPQNQQQQQRGSMVVRMDGSGGGGGGGGGGSKSGSRGGGGSVSFGDDRSVDGGRSLASQGTVKTLMKSGGGADLSVSGEGSFVSLEDTLGVPGEK